MMLEAWVGAPPAQPCRFLALNDVVLARDPARRLVRLRCQVDGQLLAVYPADGIIVATPTGSTAYNLSAGGPLVDPRLDCFVLTAICPHTLYSRPLVIDAASELALQPEAADRRSAVLVTADGQDSLPLPPGEGVVVRRAQCRARLMHLAPRSFFNRLRDKLNWGAPH
jgi:NAD+ kinase